MAAGFEIKYGDPSNSPEGIINKIRDYQKRIAQ